MNILKDFQTQAVDSISEELGNALKDTSIRRSHKIVLDSPTGSGKTLMLSNIIENCLEDTLTIVLSPGKGALHVQTLKAMKANLARSTNFNVTDITLPILQDSPAGGTVLVCNWERLTTKDKKTGEYSVYLTRDSENNNIFEYVRDGAKQQLPIVVIIDEAHYGASNDAARIQGFLKDLNDAVTGANGLPIITLEASATPMSTEDIRLMFKVDINDAIKEGLIRKSGVLNSGLNAYLLKQKDENAENSQNFEDIEEMLLDAADKKRQELNELMMQAGSSFRPLLAVQIPNSNLGAEGQARTQAYFAKQGITVENGRLVIFTSNVKEGDMDNISSPDSLVDVLIYKQAIATGWDCPRAQILVGFRHIKSQIFTIQNIGRFRRTTEARHYDSDYDALNKFYIYSNIPSGLSHYMHSQKGNGKDAGEPGEVTLGADIDKLLMINSLDLPVSVYRRVDQEPVKPSKISPVIKRIVSKNERFSSLPWGEAKTSSLYVGEYDSADLSTRKSLSEVVETGTVLKTNEHRSKIGQKEEFFNTVVAQVQDMGDYGVNTKLAEAIGNKILAYYSNNVWGNTDSGKELTQQEVISSFLSSAYHQEVLLELVKAVLEDDIIRSTKIENISDLNQAMSSEYVLFKRGVQKYPESVNVVSGSVNKIKDAFLDAALYYNNNDAGGKESYSQEKSKSSPEIWFEDGLIKFLAENKDDYILEVIHKNAPYSNGKNFSLGLRISVLSEDRTKKFVNFFPDYILILRNKQTDKTFPFIIEVKGENPATLDQYVENKSNAAKTYYEKTGIPFYVVTSTDGETKIYEKKIDFFEKMRETLDSHDGITKAKITDTNWMNDIGL